MAEKKYIDRDALINDFESDLIIRMFDNLKGTPRPKIIDIADVIKRIEEFPTEDVVEVVRCKDCKYAHYWYGNDDTGNTKYLCHYITCENYYPDVFADDFCSRGRRKENGNDRQ